MVAAGGATAAAGTTAAGGTAGNVAGQAGLGGSESLTPSDSGTAPPDRMNTDGGQTTKARSIVFDLCGSAGAGCADIDEYAGCLETFCDGVLSECFGLAYRDNDFTGGTCEPYATCVLSAEDRCENTCAPAADCAACVTNLFACVQSSACTVDSCDTPPAGGDAGPPDEVSGGCDELDECCASIADEHGRMICNDSATVAKQDSEEMCAMLYSAYRAGALCQ